MRLADQAVGERRHSTRSTTCDGLHDTVADQGFRVWKGISNLKGTAPFSQAGRFSASVGEQRLDLRSSTCPTVHAEKAFCS